jgi:integrase/recombinase XerC
VSPGGAAAGALVSDWLSELEAARGASLRTLIAYRRDLGGFLGFLTRHHGAEGWQSGRLQRS